MGQTNEFRCPSMNTEFFRDYRDCAAYITCYNGVAFPQRCPNGLRFDLDNLVCDFPDKVDCSSCPATGIVAMPISCRTYRLCVFGTSIEKECLPGTRFLEEIGECGVGEPCAFVPCERHTEGIDFHRTDDCQSYHICLDGRDVGIRHCPENTYFNTVNRTCSADPKPEDCVPVAVPTKAPKENSLPTRAPRALARPVQSSYVGYCPLDGVTMIGVPGNCNKYAICVDNQQFEFDCPEGTLFSSEEKLCTLPEFAKCQ
jgi:hypothetical protein